jgi:hypothetical protein
MITLISSRELCDIKNELSFGTSSVLGRRFSSAGSDDLGDLLTRANLSQAGTLYE